jgi:hypothetical protein
MGLVDFMQTLQEQDITYSPEPEQTIRVIPPEKSSVGIKIIPPETEQTTQKQPLKLKLKMKPPVQNVTAQPTQTARVTVEQPKQQVVQQVIQPTIIKPTVQSVQTQPIVQPQVVQQPQVQPIQQTVQPTQIVQPVQPVQQVQNVEPIEEQPQVQQPIAKTKEEILNELFISSGTEDSKKNLWIEYYNRAKTSRKQNIIVERMKIGKFTITPDNKVLILPDYDVVRKDPDDILKDHWF